MPGDNNHSTEVGRKLLEFVNEKSNVGLAVRAVDFVADKVVGVVTDKDDKVDIKDLIKHPDGEALKQGLLESVLFGEQALFDKFVAPKEEFNAQEKALLDESLDKLLEFAVIYALRKNAH